MRYRLGKAPARPGAVALKFGGYFNATKLPTPPIVFGHFKSVPNWGMLANDQYGNCVWAGAAHETMSWTATHGPVAQFSDKEVLSDYSAVTGFQPGNPETDQGTDMQQAASYRRKTGILDATGRRHTIDSYLALTPGDTHQLTLATYLLGAAAVGLLLPEDAEDLFDSMQPWDVTPHTRTVGGHYVPCIGRNSHGNFLVVTWGRLQAMTPQFYHKYCDEALGYVSLEPLKDNLSPEGFNADQLRTDLAAITKESDG